MKILLRMLTASGSRNARTLLLLTMICLAGIVQAAHFRSGTISWRPISGNTVEFKVSQSYGGWAFGGGYTLGSTQIMDYLYTGDGKNVAIPLVITSINTAEGWWYGEATFRHTYNSAGNFLAYFGSCCRISNLSNNSNQSWRNETIVNVGSGNSSPVSTVAATVNLPASLTAAQFQIPTFDPDGDQLSYSLATSAEMGGGSNPAGLSISSNGVVSFNTTGKTIGSLWNVAFTISDGTGKTKVTVDFIIKITQNSTPPIFDYLVTPTTGRVFQGTPGQAISFPISAYDNDAGNVVTLSAVGLPPGATTSPSLPTNGNPVASNFSWTPTASQFGSYVINFTATDNIGVQSTSSVTIQISLKPTFNVPPTPAANSETYLESGVAHQSVISASDPDPNDVVQLIAVTGLPAGATLSTSLPTVAANPTSVQLNWTPTSANFGVHTVSFTAKDSYNDQTTHSFKYLVNTKPTFISTPTLVAYVGQAYTYQITGIDTDVAYGDVLALVGAQIPAWLTFTYNGNGTGTLSGTPSITNLGKHQVSLKLEDTYHHNYNPVVSQNFSISVSGRSPEIINPGNQSTSATTGICGSLVNFAATETVGIPASTITYSHQPGSVFPVGTTTVTATATNVVGTSQTTFTVTVVDNQFPIIINPPANILVSCESIPALVALSATDNCTITSTLAYESMGNSMKTDLVHSYDFDNNLTDGKGTSTPTNINGVSFATGISGSALNFDGTNKYINLSTSASLDGAINFGISVWVKTSSAGQMSIVQQRDGQFNGQYILNIGSNHDGRISAPGRVYFMVYNNQFQFEIYSPNRVDDGKWHHIVAERQGTNGRIYIDGVAAGTGSGPFVALNGTIGSYVGRDVRDNTKGFIGLIDQLKIYAGGSTPKNYDLERTWSFSDASGNQSIAQQIVTVEDITAPVIGTATITTPTDADGSVIATSALGAAVNFTIPTATDNCSSNITITSSHLSGSTFPIGETVVTFTAVDEVGNEATSTLTITVKGKAPSIVVPSTITVNSAATACGAVVNFTATETTAIPASTITYSHQPGSTFPLGTTVVTATATNVVGTSLKTFEIVVTDASAPVINIPAAPVFCQNSIGSYTLPAVSATDNCGIATVSFAITGVTQRNGAGFNTGTSFNVGTSTVTYTVTDVNGNVSIKSMVVTVNKTPTATIAPSNPDAFCNKFVLVANSSSAITGYAWSYNNNSFANTQAIALDNTNGDGTYTLNVTDNKGCTSLTAVNFQYNKQSTVSNYTILAYKEAELKEYNTVQTGSVGVMHKNGKAEIGKYSSVAAAGAFVKAPKIEVKQSANVPVRIIGVASVSLPTMQYNTSNTNSLPNFTTNQGANVSLSGNYKNLKIRKGSTVILSGNTYGNIDIEEGSIVRFTSTVINVEHLKVGKGPNNGLTQVRFADNTSIRVAKHVVVEEDCFINPDGFKVTFYLGKQSNHNCNNHHDNDDDDHDKAHGNGDQKFEVKGGNTTVIANVYAPTGDIKVKGGEGSHNNHSSTVVKMTGLFIGYEVEGDGKNIFWNNYSCGTASPIAATDAQPVYNKTAEDVVVAEDLSVTVMPNPSITYFTLKLVSKSALPVNISVVDASGRLVDAKTKQASNSTLQLGHNYATGNYFAEFIQGNHRKVVQLIKIK